MHKWYDKEYLKRDLDENYNFYPGQQDFWIDTFLCFSFIRSKHELKDRKFMKWNIFPLYKISLFLFFSRKWIFMDISLSTGKRSIISVTIGNLATGAIWGYIDLYRETKGSSWLSIAARRRVQIPPAATFWYPRKWELCRRQLPPLCFPLTSFP